MITPECKFCVRYLMEHGILATDFDEVAKSLSKDDPEFKLTKVPRKTFFEQLAEGLRELWPPGEKEGKYPWRDSVENLTRRLIMLWAQRFPDCHDNQYTLEQCLTVARRYLAHYEDDTKYMRVLKYFILKQKPMFTANGKATYVNESIFADMLEGKAAEDAIENEWNAIISQVSVGEGNVI